MAIIQVRGKISATTSSKAKVELVRRRHDEVITMDVVEEQFPEFIQTDYPQMIEFIKSYYAYIGTKTEIGEIDDIKDIDFTSGDYLLKLRKEFSYNSAKFNFLSETEFIRNAKEFYASKGTEESIKFLFRILFNDDVELEYPADRIFSPSSAHWEQLKSIKVKLKENSVSPTEFIGGMLTLRNSSNVKQVIEIVDVVDITTKVDEDEPSINFEIFTPSDIFISIAIDDVVLGDDFEAEIIPSLSKVKVVNAGLNFRVGQIIKLDGAVGNGAVGVITNVTTAGAIKNVKLLRFGNNYSANFYVSVEPEGVFTDTGITVESSGSSTYNIGITDTQLSYAERFEILKSDYVLNDSAGSSSFYVAPGYSGAYASQSRSTQNFFSEDVISALLFCEIGAVCSYPGTFLTKVGAPSDYSVLQDGEFYQNFAYKIKSTRNITEYKDVLTTFGHPAGMKMFSEFSVEDKFDTEATIKLADVEVNTIYPPGYLTGRIRIVTDAQAVFPQGNALESSNTNTVSPATVSGNLTIIHNIAYSTALDSESVKAYAQGTMYKKG